MVSTPANEDMPSAPPMRPRAEHEATTRRSASIAVIIVGTVAPVAGLAAIMAVTTGVIARSASLPGGDRSGGERSPAPAEHQWARGDYR